MSIGNVSRNRAKLAYEQFGKSWRAERRYQDTVLAKGLQLPEGQKPLGKKPTFRQWMKATEEFKQRELEARRTATEKGELTKEIDLEWKEEGTDVGSAQGE
jgi:hypothetical protein